MQEMVEEITSLLDTKKAFDIDVITMNENYFVDKVIIATTLGQKHGLSLVDYLKKELKSKNIYHVEEGDDWSIIDLGDILVHLMTTEYREIYKIEEFLEEIKKKKVN